MEDSRKILDKRLLEGVFYRQFEVVRKDRSDYNFGVLLGIKTSYCSLFGIDDVYERMNDSIEKMYEED